MSNPRIEVTFYIASTPEEVWRALTDPNITQRCPSYTLPCFL